MIERQTPFIWSYLSVFPGISVSQPDANRQNGFKQAHNVFHAPYIILRCAIILSLLKPINQITKKIVTTHFAIAFQEKFTKWFIRDQKVKARLPNMNSQGCFHRMARSHLGCFGWQLVRIVIFLNKQRWVLKQRQKTSAADLSVRFLFAKCLRRSGSEFSFVGDPCSSRIFPILNVDKKFKDTENWLLEFG